MELQPGIVLIRIDFADIMAENGTSKKILETLLTLPNVICSNGKLFIIK